MSAHVVDALQTPVIVCEGTSVWLLALPDAQIRQVMRQKIENRGCRIVLVWKEFILSVPEGRIWVSFNSGWSERSL